jgi:hypothetical protein
MNGLTLLHFPACSDLLLFDILESELIAHCEGFCSFRGTDDFVGSLGLKLAIVLSPRINDGKKGVGLIPKRVLLGSRDTCFLTHPKTIISQISY